MLDNPNDGTEPAKTLERLLAPRLHEALNDTPAVLIHGPRQSGKTTLAQLVGAARGYHYVTFDDAAILTAAQADPIGFVSRLPERCILDEVQRFPELFVSLKAEIDRRRTPGRFILTGSANVLLLPRLSDSLAGRLEVLRLHPLSQAELSGSGASFLDRLLSGDFATSITERLGPELAHRIIRGGFPAAVARSVDHRRRAWYRHYIETQVQRDVRELARIRSLDVLPKLLRLIAAHTASPLNVADLAAPFELTRATILDYVELLERVFLIDRLPAWHSHQMSRLVKRPKLHIADTGIGGALLGVNPQSLDEDRTTLGALLETFVLQELKREASGRVDVIDFYHYRDRDGAEVDIVIEQGNQSLAGIEVKAAASVGHADLRGVRKLSALVGDRFKAGVVLYDGASMVSFGDRLYAVPIRALWDPM